MKTQLMHIEIIQQQKVYPFELNSTEKYIEMQQSVWLVCVCVHEYVRVCVCVWCLCVYVYVYECMCVYVCMLACACVYYDVCTCMYMCVCVCAHHKYTNTSHTSVQVPSYTQEAKQNAKTLVTYKKSEYSTIAIAVASLQIMQLPRFKLKV